jgi:Ni,Fe-hydrogenase III small subunit
VWITPRRDVPQLTSPAYQKSFEPHGSRVFTVVTKGVTLPSLFQKIFQIGMATEALGPGDPELIELVQQVDQAARRVVGRALAIREVDAGSCNGCEIEITGLTSPVYDSERFGLHFVASPRHADLLLVTGPVTRNMEVALRKTYDATPDPKLVVAVGDCARTCGVFKGSYAVAGSVDQIIPVNVFVHGCPPEPADILRGILTALERAPK